MYQSIQGFKDSPIRSGAGDANYFEPLLDQIIIYFNKLMEVYQSQEDGNKPRLSWQV